MKLVAVLMYLGAALLPTIGLVRVYRREWSRDVLPLDSKDSAKYSEVQAMMQRLKRDLRDAAQDAKWDLVLVGAGLALGASAGIWSLWL